MALRSRMRHLVFNEILGPIKERKVFILDDFTTRMINNVLTQSEIVNQCDVVTIQKVQAKPHAANGAFSAVYFMRATEKNVQKFIDDFSTKPCPYSKAYIFITNTCPDAVFSMLQKSTVPKQKLQTFSEVYCDYICYSENSFSLDAPDHFNIHFNPVHSHIRGYESMKIASKLVSVCVQLGHYPSQIRYFRGNCRDANNEIATQFKRSLSHFKIENEDFEWKSTNSTVLILDRGFDTVTPVIHDLTTEALARDLLSIDVETNSNQTRNSSDRKTSYFPNQYVYTVEMKNSDVEREERVAYLDDSNALWTKIRFMNIKDSVDYMRYEIGQMQKQKQLEAGNIKDLTLTELSALMKKYPEQRKNKQQIGALSYVLDATLQGFAREQIECEQMLATNCAKKAKECKNWKFVSDLLKKDARGELNNALTVHEKMRLLVLYSRSKANMNGITLKELKTRMQESDVTLNYMPILTNLTFLGVPILTQDYQWVNYEDQERNWKNWPCCDREGNIPVRPDRMPDLVQWCPTIYHLVKTMIDSPKDLLQKYPVIEIRSKPAVPRGTVKSARRVRTKASKKSSVYSTYGSYNKSSFIVFVAGGMTYGEIKMAKVLSDKYNGEVGIVFGSTQIMNPDDFIEKLHNLNPEEIYYKHEDGQFIAADATYN